MEDTCAYFSGTIRTCSAMQGPLEMFRYETSGLSVISSMH